MRTFLGGLLLVALGACSNVVGQERSCADQVRQFETSSGLTVQGGSARQLALRSSAQMYAHQAAEAAKRGDEETCRRNLDQARTALN